MFLKPFRIKTQTNIKGSDRKKLRAAISQQFADLKDDEITSVIPQKDPMTTVKLCTNSGDNIVVYCTGDNPVYFEFDRRLFPTVYTLWKLTDLLPCFTTWPPVFKPMSSGADLMLPGIVTKGEVTPSTYQHINKGMVCSVNLHGNRAPIAVSTSILSGDDMYASGMKGKGFRIIHILGDELWKMGDKSDPPDIPDASLVTMETNEEDKNPGDNLQHDTESEALNVHIQHNEISQEITNGAACLALQDKEEQNDEVCSEADGASRTSSPTNTTEADEDDDDEATNNVTPEEQEELLQFCFKCAIKARIKKNDLPILTSTFFKKHMVPYSFGKMLDIKKTRFKKLSKFLHEMEKDQYIKVKELSKGSHSIVEVDRSHIGLRDVDIPDIVEEEDSGASNTYKPPTITELYSITTAVLPVVRHAGYKKGSTVTSGEFRQIITEYVKTNNLQDEQHKGYVRLDPHLADCCLQKSEGDVPVLRWEDVFNRLLNKLQQVTKVEFVGQPAVIRKGKMDCITLDVKQRASNKKVTLVERLDTFGINPEEFAHRVQVAVACSTSVSPLPQKNTGMQVMIQGNQIIYVAELLMNDYKIPKKYINGLDKMPKNRKR